MDKLFYEIQFHVDELKRMKKRNFKPFVCELDKKYENQCSVLEKGILINDWDQNVTLHSCQDGSLDDRLSNNSELYLFSDKVISVLNENLIRGIQYLPVNIYSQASIKIPDYNFVANFYNSIDCLNKEKSLFTVFGENYPTPDPSYNGKIRTIEKIVLDKKRLPDDIDVFRLGEKRLWVFVSEKFVDIWRNNRFSNLEFASVEIC